MYTPQFVQIRTPQQLLLFCWFRVSIALLPSTTSAALELSDPECIESIRDKEFDVPD